MNFCEKLQTMRKEKGLSQEALAEMLNVSRQSVSKWESGQSYPEMEKLITLSEIFGVTIDSLIKNGELQEDKQNTISQPYWTTRGNFYEYKSKRMMFGLPMIHINIGLGARKAKGIIAIGNISTGIVSIGIIARGILSIGILSLGIIGLGTLALAILALGSITIGVFSIGGIALGIFSLGAIAIGMFSTGGLAVASHIAIGGQAYGHIAVGSEHAEGTRVFLDSGITNNFSTISGTKVREAIREEFPRMREWVIKLATVFLRN